MKCLTLTCIWMVTLVGSWGLNIIPVPDLQPRKQFNISEAQGMWYAVEKYNSDPVSHQSCVALRVKTSNYGDVFPYTDSAFFTLSLVDRRADAKQEFAGFAISFAPGMLFVSFLDPGYTERHLIMVLATDYDNFAVVTNCVQQPKLVCLDVFILVRQRKPDDSQLQNARQAVQDRGFPLDDKVEMYQTNCPELELK